MTSDNLKARRQEVLAAMVAAKAAIKALDAACKEYNKEVRLAERWADKQADRIEALAEVCDDVDVYGLPGVEWEQVELADELAGLRTSDLIMGGWAAIEGMDEFTQALESIVV